MKPPKCQLLKCFGYILEDFPLTFYKGYTQNTSKIGEDIMDKTLLVILVDKRRESATQVQKMLTEEGCLIKTRLGIHDGTLDRCSNAGLIILEMVGEKEKHITLSQKLKKLDGVTTELMHLSLKD
jgi:hypothetical protein